MRGERHGNKLPHSIAVCLAKFDDDRVFRFACEQGNVRLNPRTGQPEVMDAKRLFDGLCHAFPHGSLREIQQQIEQYFAPSGSGTSCARPSGSGSIPSAASTSRTRPW